MPKPFKIGCLNVLASAFCFVTHSHDVVNNTGTLIICVAIAMISYAYLTISFVFHSKEVPTTQTEGTEQE